MVWCGGVCPTSRPRRGTLARAATWQRRASAPPSTGQGQLANYTKHVNSECKVRFYNVYIEPGGGRGPFESQWAGHLNLVAVAESLKRQLFVIYGSTSLRYNIIILYLLASSCALI